MSNTYGKMFRLTTFGESHGKAIGAVIDGCPAGLAIDEAWLQRELDRRRPGQNRLVSSRRERDTVSVLSGVHEGKTTGAPIAMMIYNEDARPKDYDHLALAFRPSHADFTWQQKYGHRDHRGGGRSSARETVARVAGGAIAKMLLRTQSIDIQAFVSQIGQIILEKNYTALDLAAVEQFDTRCPDADTNTRMSDFIRTIKKKGDTVGGVVTCVVRNCPAGLGEPVFDKLHAELAKAMLSINAAKGFEIGSGFAAARMLGSEHNDLFFNDLGNIRTRTNFSGGVQGGISNGMDIVFRVAFKPVATLLKDQTSVDADGREIVLPGKGRHDPCVVPRAVPIVEAMTALVLADFWLRQQANRW